MVCFNSSISPSQKSPFESNFNKISLHHPAECPGLPRSPPAAASSKAGERGKACFTAIGWNSVDAHIQFRETSHFKDNITRKAEYERRIHNDEVKTIENCDG